MKQWQIVQNNSSNFYLECKPKNIFLAIAFGCMTKYKNSNCIATNKSKDINISDITTPDWIIPK